MSNNGILEDIKDMATREIAGIGYRKDEQVLSLVDADQADIKDAEVTISKSLSRYRPFTRAQADTMSNEALKLGVIDTAFDFPVMLKKEPEVAWEYIEVNPINPRLMRLSEVFLVESDEDGLLTYKDSVGEVDPMLSEQLDSIELLTKKGIGDHLSSGYCAQLKISNGEVSWVDIPNYELLKQWRIERQRYKDAVSAWERLKSDIGHAKSFDRALKQYERLKGLPFDWHIDIKQILSGLSANSNGTGDNDRTVFHVVVDNDCKIGRFSRVKGEFLCTAKSGAPNWTTQNYQHVIKVAGVRVKTIPYEVTCKTCHERINSLLSKKDNAV